jgi:GxxExxY protein
VASSSRARAIAKTSGLDRIAQAVRFHSRARPARRLRRRRPLAVGDATSTRCSCESKETTEVLMLVRSSPLVHTVIGCAIAVHRALGPGLLESAYGRCVQHELTQRGLHFRPEVPLPLIYDGVALDCAYRADLIVEDTLLVEFKSVDHLLPIHQTQVLTYLKLADLHHGLLINFNVSKLVDGIRSVVR